MTKASDSPNKMTAREHAAMTLKVPTSGTDWLDQMITEARRLDNEAFAARLAEPEVSHEGTQSLPDPDQAAARAKRPPQGPKNPPEGGVGKKIG